MAKEHNFPTRLDRDRGTMCYACTYAQNVRDMRAMIIVGDVTEFICPVCMASIQAYIETREHKLLSYNAMKAIVNADILKDEQDAIDKSEYQRTGIQH